ncbi:MAG: phosphomevalonate kinase, partial [Actinomyces sp.]
LDDMAVYKLALLATDAVQPIGSGGDIAASSFTGWVAYTSPDRAWLHQVSGAPGTGNSPGGSAGLSELVRMDWPLLSIRRLPAPGLRLSVGWTGSPASTPRLVADVQAHTRGAQDAAYTAFLRESEACLSALTLALREDDGGEIGLRIQEGRRLLLGLTRTSGIVIETPPLRRLVEIAQEHGAVAKSSGAGGGDCGIALCPPGTDVAAMHAAWESAGIQPLDLRVHSHSGDDS